MKRSLVLEISIALLVTLFLYSGVSKLMDFAAFKRAMHNQPFPAWLAIILTSTLPTLEIAIATVLIFGKTRRFGLYAFFILMLLFTGYIAAILLHYFPRVPCSCGGAIKVLSWGQHFYFNCFFLALAAIAIKMQKQVRDQNNILKKT